MDTYHCECVSQGGKRQKLILLANTERQAFEIISNRGLHPIKIQREAPWLTRLRKPFRTLPEEALLFFIRQISFSLHSGQTLLQAMFFLQREATHPVMRGFLRSLEQNLLQGMSFSESLADTPYHLPPLVIQWAEIGERQGRLDRSLEDAAKLLEDQRKLKQRLRSQSVYPLMVLGLVLMVTGLLFFIALPVLAQTYIDLHETIPWYVILALQMRKLFIIFPVFFIALLFFLFFRRKKSGSSFSDGLSALSLKVPGVKGLVAWSFFVPFARALGQLMDSGVSAGEAMGILEGQPGFRSFRREINQANAALLAGSDLSRSLLQCSFIPGLARELIGMGERSGQLPTSLLRMADYYEEQLANQSAFLTRMIEPIAIILLGGVVLLVALLLFLPLIDSYQLYLR